MSLPVHTVATLLDELPATARAIGPMPATVAWCTERDHPWSTYNPWMDRTWCRCGQRQDDGQHPIDLEAIHELFHHCQPNGPCSCYADRGREQWTEYQREIRERHRNNPST